MTYMVVYVNGGYQVRVDTWINRTGVDVIKDGIRSKEEARNWKKHFEKQHAA